MRFTPTRRRESGELTTSERRTVGFGGRRLETQVKLYAGRRPYLTFSTSRVQFPQVIAQLNSEGEVEVGQELQKIIIENGFEINRNKVRLQTREDRQSVTGITVNVKTRVESYGIGCSSSALIGGRWPVRRKSDHSIQITKFGC